MPESMDSTLLIVFMQYVLPFIVFFLLLLLAIFGFFVRKWMRDMENAIKLTKEDNDSVQKKIESIHKNRFQDSLDNQNNLNSLHKTIVSEEIKPLWEELKQIQEASRKEFKEELDSLKKDLTGLLERLLSK